jgi:CheY-like chemotaxis protein
MGIDADKKGEFKILVAEDNTLNQKLIVSLLNKNNFKVVTAENGEEAFKSYKTENPDLILMDVEMPVSNGYEAVLKIREIEKNYSSRIPIIALTGHYLQEDIGNIYRCGMDDYLAKPIDFNVFIDKILLYLGINK